MHRHDAIDPESDDGGRAERLAAAARVLPQGASSGRRAEDREVVVHARGATLCTADGRVLTDVLLGSGTITVGHGDPRVLEAVVDAVRACDGTAVGPQPGEVELAELLCALVPSAERVAFCSSSELALIRAVGLARAASGRRRALAFRGCDDAWHGRRVDGPTSWGREPGVRSVRARVSHDLTVLEFNDVDGVAREFTSEDPPGVVVVEPYVHAFGCVAPAPGFLETLRAACSRAGAVLIFDESRTAFRCHLGGYQAVCGVVPDLTVLGEAMGNGFAIAAIAGRSSILELLGDTAPGHIPFNGALNGTPYAIAAARATLGILVGGALEGTHRTGERIRTGLREAVEASGASASVTGIGDAWTVWATDAPPTDFASLARTDRWQAERLRDGMLAGGVLEPGVIPGDRRCCTATTDDDVDRIVRAAAAALERIAG